MDPDWDAKYPPIVSKACKTCNQRKVRCDLQLPQCSTCHKNGQQCNVTDHVTYSYAAVQSLQSRIKALQNDLNTLTRILTEPTSQVPASHQPIQPQREPRTTSDVGDVRKEAEEIGVLAVGRPDSCVDKIYMGSATGSTFARIFFKQIELAKPSPAASLRRQEAEPGGNLFRHNAALPPQPVAKFLCAAYIRRVHAWWPFVCLPFLRQSFNRLYDDPARCSSYQKFLVFLVLALASVQSSESLEYRRMLDINSPKDYYQTGLRFFFDSHDHCRDLQGLHAILLVSLWMLESNARSHGNDLWHLGRYAMSTALEMGLHRRAAAAGDFSADDVEVRNRTWWCIYSLERQVAVITGRVLSVRDHAIDAPKPVSNSNDALSSSEAQAAPVVHLLNVKLFNQLVLLRQIGGRVLESVYIARGSDGKASRTTFQQIRDEIDQIQTELQNWKREMELLDIKDTREYSEITVEHGLLLLLMYRPSPTFMIPSREMVEICSRAVCQTVGKWLNLAAEHGISAVCRCYRHVHAILMVGLAGLYCDWYGKTVAHNDHPHLLHSHGKDVADCIDLMERGISWMREDDLLKYRSLLQAARIKVYGPSAGQPQGFLGEVAGSATAHPTNSSHGLGLFNADESNNITTQLFIQGDGLDTYVSEVTGYFDASHTNMDEGLEAWYASFLEEFQGGSNEETSYSAHTQ